MIETGKRVAFLKSIHLFHDFKDDELLEVADLFEEVSYEEGEIIIEQGSTADSFYIIYSGKVRVVRVREAREQELAVMVDHDYFGEMELNASRIRSASVIASEPTTVLRLSIENYQKVLKTYPTFKPNVEISIASRKLARKLRFQWLQQGEVIYFLARKHPFFLVQSLIAPVLALLAPAFLFIWGGLTGAISPVVFGSVLLVLILGWGIWNAIDWGNDYYIVTNRRVIWMEKVIGLYDSRQEAPLKTILSVGVETDVTGRILDYGDVIVRTYVGSIIFKHVHYPNQARSMVEEYWQRTKQGSAIAEKEAFKDALREKLGLVPPEKEKEKETEEPKKEEKKKKRPSLLQIAGASINIFKMRYEDGSTITYRKHWFVLLKQTWLPGLIWLGLIGIWISRLITLARSPELSFITILDGGTRVMDTASIALPLIMVPFALWWLYQYVDWANDVFRVTSDQIMDIDRKPLGTEERRTAPLDNILSTKYQRLGVAGYLFNFGTVYITVGGSQLAFEDVMDPAAVQADIDQRRAARIAAKAANERAAERNRMAEWMASYHQNVDEIRREQERQEEQQKTE
ncbi:MAG: hypothetical protein Kow002_11280 [Anaerolineales bacterium]